MHAATQSAPERADAPLAAPPIDQRIDELSADVVIIGGGPGGSTAGALLAQRGWRVLLLEKDRHPRFHI
ncbi:MAG TPA: FAD-dependent oxidoreductase, partial [Burkholderiaceae bacterium]|nr:FAD-dependent oxidoreductase [Burkholderiaceae bacterium]